MNDQAISTQEAADEAFVRSANRKDYEGMEAALAQGANVDVSNVRGVTPLHAAVLNKNIALVDWLVRKGANPSLQNLTGDSALHDAARAESPEFLTALLKSKKVKVDVENTLATTPLIEAAMCSRLDNVKALLNAGADPVKRSRQGGASALLVAAQRQRYEMVKLLLKAGANPNDANNYGVTALIAAVATSGVGAEGGDGNEGANSASAKTLRLLLDAGADVNAASDSGNTPLAEASLHANRPAMVALLDAGANPNVKSAAGVGGGVTPLMIAAVKGDVELLGRLVASGADVNFVSEKKLTALAMAMRAPASNDKERAKAGECIEALLEAGARLAEAKNQQGLGHYAAATGNVELMRVVASRGSLEDQDENGATAAFYAIARRDVALVEELAALGANFNAKDAKGNTMLQGLARQPCPGQIKQAIGLMRQQNDEKLKAQATALEREAHETALGLFQRLLDLGVGINEPNAQGDTALHTALMSYAHGNCERRYIDFLVDHGASLSVRNEQEASPFVQVIKMGDVELAAAWAQRLIDQGAQAEVETCVYDVSWTAPEHEAQVRAVKAVFEKLIPMGAQLDYQDQDGQFALLVAAATNQEDLALALLELGANVNLRNHEGEVAAFHSVKENRANITRILFEHGCDPDATRNDGDSLMTIAYEHQRSTAVQQIIEARQTRQARLDEEEAQKPRKAAP
jgi:ankyrin repeat protein